MSRAALAATVAAIVWLGGLAAASGRDTGLLDPHLDSSVLRRGCTACHEGHGASRSPMLPGPQRDLCLTCHGFSVDLERLIAAGEVSANVNPALLGSLLQAPYVHPVSRDAFEAESPGAVTCTSCHSPHRGLRDSRGSGDPPGRRLRSTKNPNRFEYQLCESCHGNRGATTQSVVDISRLFNPSNRSYHPVEAPARESSPSVLPALTGGEINCTDCHGNADPTGPSGPHGSTEPYLLRARYTTVDGASESAEAYALCYTCHARSDALAAAAFPEHEQHIVDLRASCATCHNAHGSVINRALIRFGEETIIAGVGPSALTGRLAFVSSGPGSGACYLTCHGRDHAPEGYGLGTLPPAPGRP